MFLFVTAFWCLTAPSVSAQNDAYSSDNIIPDILYWRTDESFRDPSKALEQSKQFQKRTGLKYQTGQHVWLWWQKPEGFRFAEGQNFLLGQYFTAVKIDLFWQRADNSWGHRAYDSAQGHDEFVLGERSLLSFPEPIQNAQRIMIRLDRPLRLLTLSDLRFVNEQSVNDGQNTLRVFFGVLLGIVGAMFIYNLILYYALRIPMQLLYLVYSSGVILYIWNASGLYGPIKPLLTGTIPMHFPHIAFGVMGWGIFMFVRHVMDRKYFPSFVGRFMLVAAYAVVILTALALVISVKYYPTALFLRDVVGGGTTVFFFVFAIYAVFQGSRATMLLLLALFVPAVATILTFIWSYMGWAMPFWLDQAMPASLAIENLLLAAVIADRIRRIRLERDEARREQEELAQKANTDFLTNVYNRRFIVDYGKALFGSANGREDVAVVMLDLDRFKYVNDTFGHDVGDEVLAMTAEVCTQNLRPDDLIGRFGGEEFLIILPRTDPETAQAVTERLRRSLHSISLPGLSALGVRHISASFGVATGKTGVSNMNELIKRADEALLQAKERGRDQVVVWDPFY